MITGIPRRAGYLWGMRQVAASPSLGRRLAPTLLAVLVACGGSDPSSDLSIEIAGGNGQNAPVGTAVPTPPSVQVTTSNGSPAANTRVTFTVASGSGSVLGGTQQTDANGIASVGDWVLGTVAGQQQLNASVPGTPAVSFTATATAGSPAQVSPSTPANVTAPPGAPVSPAPAVLVEDDFGNGVPGVSVTWQVQSGGGSISGASSTTDASGVARVGSWTLGVTPGTNTLRATVQGSGIQGNPVTFTATASQSSYAIDLRTLSSMTPSQQQAFQSARLRLERLITGDLSNVQVTLPGGSCSLSSFPPMNEVVDDLVIFAEVISIDGPGMTLGRAGPCVFRGGGGLPLVGIMQFDVADLNGLESAGLLGAVILHEMLHVVGVGSAWVREGLLSGGGGTDPIFTGLQAISSFNAIGGTAYTGNKVPVENTGGTGTRDSHWRETVFKSELMTGFLNNGTNPLSVVTASSLSDIGYTVSLAEADPFTISPPFTVPTAAAGGVLMRDDGWNGPILEIDPAGRVRRLR
jgi:Bacterial Ig-like domain (group 1)/Leishmanolysin